MRTRRVFLVPLLFCLLIANTGFAQQKKMLNLPKYDLKLYHFGFILGVNQMFFTVKTIPDLKNLDSLYVVESLPQMGFNIGIVSNLNIGENVDLRFIPTLSFGQRNMKYTLNRHDTLLYDVTKKVESTYIDFPFELKYKSKRINNFRAYVLTGAKMSIDLASQAKQKEQKDQIEVKLKKNDFSWEFGVGFDFYTTFFKFGTELKMSYGIRNLLTSEDNVFYNGIDRLSSKIFQLSFTFE